MPYENRGTCCCPHCGGRLDIIATMAGVEVAITKHKEEGPQGELRPEGLPKGTDAKAPSQGEGARLKRGPKPKGVFDKTTYQREYMRGYMARRRAKERDKP